MILDQIVRGDSRLVGLLGYPVAHSISPRIHNHAFRSLDLNFVYIPLAVKPDSLGRAILAMRSLGFAGANVTIPHKVDATRYCDVLSPLSTATGTVNTLYMKDGLMHGTTTDPAGFYRALSSMGCELKGRDVVLLGNGGTARTLAFAIAIDRLPSSLTIVGRNEFKVSSLAREIDKVTGFTVSHCTFDEKSRLAGITGNCSLLVNTTSVGMHPLIDETPLDPVYFHQGMTVFDVIYNPIKTKFLMEAEKRGCRVQNGLRMLLFQALESSKLWSGVEVPESIFDIEELQNLILR